MSEPREPDYCPRCGAAYEPLQEYCLECGARLPTNRGVLGYLAGEWQRRLAWYPGDWVWPVLGFLVLTAAATAAAVAAASTSRSSAPLVATGVSISVGPGAASTAVPTTTIRATLPGAPRPTITTGPLPAAPGAPSTGAATGRTPTTATTPTPTGPNGLAAWPANESGYTDVLLSLPLSAGRAAAEQRARAAKAAGLQQVGVLSSSDYSSLHPGYYVVFSGIYATSAEASSRLGSARLHGFSGAYQARVTR